MLPIVLNNTIINHDKLLLIKQCLENVRQQNVPGYTAELGVYRGGTSKMIALEMPDRTHYAFDTFAGLKNATPEHDKHKNDDFSDVDFSAVAALLSDPNIVIKAGYFPETVADMADATFSFVHIDADTYQSTHDALIYFYPRLSPGGFIVIDDYDWQHCPGVDEAVHEFLKDKPEKLEHMVANQAVICRLPTDTQFLRLWFDHGLGDCAHFVQMLQLYRRRNYIISVHFHTNKQELWRGSGFPFTQLNGTAYHKFPYDTLFNRPQPLPDWSGSKLAFNLTQAPLPDIVSDGRLSAVWEELVAIDEKARISQYIPADICARVDNYLANLPRPIALLHSNGTNWAGDKNIPFAEVAALYPLLLDNSAGSVVLLDWDFRVPQHVPSCRLRHLAEDLGHIDVATLIELIRRSDLLIGVDSGPLHMAVFTDTPVLGVFHHLYPSCVTLPRPQSAFMTRNAASYQPINQARRKRWSIIEYAGALPSAKAIATHSIRMLKGPRYLTKNRAGRDAMLQQFVCDWLQAAPPGVARADRNVTMDWTLRETAARFAAPNIVETGCQRAKEDWSAGCSTYIFGAYLEGIGAGHLSSVDISAVNLSTAKICCEPWNDYISYHVSDSVKWLDDYKETIDLLYLDSLDADDPRTAEHGLLEFKAALPKLHSKSIVVIDDTLWSGAWKEYNSGKWVGKAADIVPFALNNGWRLVCSGYQVVLIKNDSVIEQA